MNGVRFSVRRQWTNGCAEKVEETLVSSIGRASTGILDGSRLMAAAAAGEVALVEEAASPSVPFLRLKMVHIVQI